MATRPAPPVSIILALATLGTTPALHAQADQSAAPEVLKLERDLHNRMTVPVRIGSQGPFDFLIDTGSERTVLSREVATKLALAISGTATVVGVAGSVPVELVEIDEISLGKRTYYTLTAPLLDDRFIGADGIVGIDSLQDQRVLIDFAENRMQVGDAATLGGSRGFEIVVRARRKSGQLIMANAIIDGVRTDIVIDTGSDSSIGNIALRKALSRRRTMQSTTLMSVTGQSIDAEMAMASTINVEGLKLNNVVTLKRFLPYLWPADRSI
jgi:predicted aspartyl protease